MRLAFLLATLGLLLAPLRPAAAQRGGSAGQRREPKPPPKTPPAPPPASSGVPTRPSPGEPAAPTGQAPNVPAGMTAAEASTPVPDTGTITRIEIQGNRRVESDAIRAALPLRPGDTFDRRKLREALLGVWKTGYFNDVKIDVSPVKVPGTGYQLTVLVSEKPAIR